jgi:hypothetical protein
MGGANAGIGMARRCRLEGVPSVMIVELMNVHRQYRST